MQKKSDKNVYILLLNLTKKRIWTFCIWTFSLGPFAAGPLILRTFHCQTFPCRIFHPWTFWGRTFQGRIFCRCTEWRAVSPVGYSSTGVQPKGSDGAPCRGSPGKVQSAIRTTVASGGWRDWNTHCRCSIAWTSPLPLWIRLSGWQPERARASVLFVSAGGLQDTPCCVF
jgi:hypothetical protein